MNLRLFRYESIKKCFYDLERVGTYYISLQMYFFASFPEIDI